MKPLLGPKKVKEIGRKMDIDTMVVYDWDYRQDHASSKKYIWLQLMDPIDASNPELWAKGPETTIECLVEFKPMYTFTSSYASALSNAIPKLNGLKVESNIAPPSLSYAFILNHTHKSILTSQVTYTDQMNGPEGHSHSHSHPIAVTPKYVLYPNQAAELISRIESNMNPGKAKGKV